MLPESDMAIRKVLSGIITFVSSLKNVLLLSFFSFAQRSIAKSVVLRSRELSQLPPVSFVEV